MAKTCKEIKAERRARNQCEHCPEPRAPGDLRFCDVHREKWRAYCRAYIQRLRKSRNRSGVCKDCKNPLAPGSKAYCADHLRHYRELMRIRKGYSPQGDGNGYLARKQRRAG